MHNALRSSAECARAREVALRDARRCIGDAMRDVVLSCVQEPCCSCWRSCCPLQFSDFRQPSGTTRLWGECTCVLDVRCVCCHSQMLQRYAVGLVVDVMFFKSGRISGSYPSEALDDRLMIVITVYPH